jgi:DNA-binding transcriptional ArsR family regulator
MGTKTPVSCVASIGEVAGEVWKALSENGPMTMAKLVKAVGEPRDAVMQAVGWLAREGKLSIDDQGRNRMIALSDGRV